MRYLTIRPGDMALSVGDTLQLEATYGNLGPGLTGHVVANSRIDSTKFVWSSSDTTVARVGRFGLVFALRPGATKISAEHNGFSGNFPLVLTVCAVPGIRVSGGTCQNPP